ncbi:MAG: HD domain-containing protein, partial [Planctomycetota bacterium]
MDTFGCCGYDGPFIRYDRELMQDFQLKIFKECHTHRVCNEIRQLTAALKMDENDSLVAETIALLHDVGRFPQFQKHRTYKDT